MANWFRYGWRRKILIRFVDYMPAERLRDRVVDFLYPDAMGISFKDL